MPEFQVKIPHHRTLDDARKRLESAVDEARGRFGAFVRKVDWSEDHNTVTMAGPGFVVSMKVDAEAIQAECDFPVLGRLLGRSVRDGLRQILNKQLG